MNSTIAKSSEKTTRFVGRKCQRKSRFSRRSRRGVIIPVLAEVISHADGSVLLRPRTSRMTETGDTWLTPGEACKMLGLSPRVVYRYCDQINPYFACRRPARGKLLISMKTVSRFYQATLHPDFWTDKLQQREVRQFAQEILQEHQRH